MNFTKTTGHSPLFVRSNGVLHALRPDDIRFVHSSGNYCEIHTTKRQFLVKKSLASLIEVLQPYGLRQVHRSYLVGLHHIDRVHATENRIELGEQRIPLGRKYREPLLENLRVI